MPIAHWGDIDGARFQMENRFRLEKELEAILITTAEKKICRAAPTSIHFYPTHAIEMKGMCAVIGCSARKLMGLFNTQMKRSI
jgi:hypothetical protein